MLQQFNPKNESIKVYIDGKLLPREEAKVSVFDSVVQGGDAVWEGIRVYNGKVFCLTEHLQRLLDSAHAMAFTDIPTMEEVKSALFKTLKANEMQDGVHVRLTLTRGLKTTSGMDPRLNKFGPTLIILAEWKPPVYPPSITLSTATIRRNSPSTLDSKIHHNNLINNILAKIQSNLAGTDAALMLDLHGYVSEANGTNIFMIRNGKVFTPTADSCLHGITRATVIKLCKENEIPIKECNLSLTEFYTADQVFVTGTMGELTPVNAIDGRAIVNKSTTDEFVRINALFSTLTKSKGEVIV